MRRRSTIRVITWAYAAPGHDVSSASAAEARSGMPASAAGVSTSTG